MQQPDFAGFAERFAERQGQLDSGMSASEAVLAAPEGLIGATEDAVQTNNVAWQALRRVIPADRAITHLDTVEKNLSLTGRKEILGPYGAYVLADVAVTTALRDTKENHELLQQAQKVPSRLRFIRRYHHRRDATAVAQRLRKAELQSCEVKLSAPLHRSDPTSEAGRYEEVFTSTRVSPLEELEAQPAAANPMDALNATAKTIQFTSFLNDVKWLARSSD